MYIYIYIYAYTYIYMYICTHLYTYIHRNTHIHTTTCMLFYQCAWQQYRKYTPHTLALSLCLSFSHAYLHLQPCVSTRADTSFYQCPCTQDWRHMARSLPYRSLFRSLSLSRTHTHTHTHLQPCHPACVLGRNTERKRFLVCTK